ncbi:MAG: hypothetical protein JXA99_09960 [Candidatus Lokiarchaeota archaeon]|nr:hypothetical protein [Candidatus Lokiarchaeota archaeon]
MNIWILNSESGVTLVYQAYQELMANEDLVSGLLTALNHFTVFEFKEGIESIEMGGLRWVYLEEKEGNLLFVAADNKDVSAEILRARLNIIKQSFIHEFVKNNDFARFLKEEWNGNISKFYPFKKIIDEYYHQWKEAETITTIAEFFDILGIFQQILNMLINILLSLKDKELIYTELEEMFNKLKKDPNFFEDKELQKISFSRDSGFNIININPSGCDMMVVERSLISLIKNVIKILKNRFGPKLTLYYFKTENIFSYLISNLILLKELNLDKFLLSLFLLE